jgi:hypothetical protein
LDNKYRICMTAVFYSDYAMCKELKNLFFPRRYLFCRAKRKRRT